MDNRATTKEAKRFVKYLSKMTLIEFIGIAQMLCVPFSIDNNPDNIREFDEVFSDMYDKFIQLKQEVRHEILQTMKKVVKGR